MPARRVLVMATAPPLSLGWLTAKRKRGAETNEGSGEQRRISKEQHQCHLHRDSTYKANHHRCTVANCVE